MTTYNKTFHPKAVRRMVSKTGATIDEVAKCFGCSRAKILMWMLNHDDFKEQYYLGRKEFDKIRIEAVDGKLYQRATGYEIPVVEVQKEYRLDEKTGIKKLVSKKVKSYMRHIPSSVTAAMFFLTNKDSENYRHTKSVELGGSNGDSIQFDVSVLLPDNGREI